MPKPSSTKTVDQSRACVSRGECAPRHRSSKSTRRWCRGKVGVEHEWEWVPTSVVNPHASDSGPSRRGVGELGYLVYAGRCAKCLKHSRFGLDIKVACHCGAEMVPVPRPESATERWGRRRALWAQSLPGGFVIPFGARWCPACDYVPTDSIATRTVRKDGARLEFETVMMHPRKPCRCEKAGKP